MAKNAFSLVLCLMLVIAGLLGSNSELCAQGRNKDKALSTMRDTVQVMTLLKRVDKLMSLYPDSARRVNDSLLKIVDRSSQTAVWIKAQINSLWLKNIKDVDRDSLFIRALEQKVASKETRSTVEGALWHYALASAYEKFYEQNESYLRYTEVASIEDSTHFTTWAPARFVGTILHHYEAAYQPIAALQKESAEAWHPLIDSGSNSLIYRPTLFDIVAFALIRFLAEPEVSLYRGTAEFTVDANSALQPLKTFLAQKFVAPNGLPSSDFPKLRVLEIYQDILRFHQSRNALEPLIDADLLRLEFAEKLTSDPDKAVQFRETLRSMIALTPASPGLSLARYHLAKSLQDADSLEEARSAATLAMTLFPESIGASRATSLLKEMERAHLALSIPSTVVPGRPIPIGLEFRNVGRVFYRITGPHSTTTRAMQYWDKNALELLLNNNIIRSWSKEISKGQDYRMHRTIDIADSLPAGHYVIAVSESSSFPRDAEKVTAYAFVKVSNFMLTLQHRPRSQDDTSLNLFARLVDLQSGEGIKGAAYHVGYLSSEGSETELLPKKRGMTQDGGSIDGLIPLQKNRYGGVDYREAYVLASVGKDTAYLTHYFYPQHRSKSPLQRTLLFTDRAVYRPGQTIFVKALVLEDDPSTFGKKVVTGESVELGLFDNNNEKLGSFTARTNEFGSLTGTFTIPRGRNLGMMYIRSLGGNGGMSVMVAEYKRPKFEVKSETLRVSPKLGDSVTVSGLAETFSGAPVDNAKVKYRITRQVYIRPLPWYYRHSWREPVGENDVEILSGETKTRSDGRYSIPFELVGSRLIDPATKPRFTFTVSADVTDANGETQSLTTTLQVGYHDREIEQSVPELIRAESGGKVEVSTTNLSSVGMATPFVTVIEKLRQPAKYLRPRLLAQPDVQLLDSIAFKSAFPDDPFGDEDNPYAWPVQMEVKRVSQTTDSNGRFSISLSGLVGGTYRIRTRLASEPDSLAQVGIVNVFETSPFVVPKQKAIFGEVKPSYNIGEQLSLTVGSSLPSAMVDLSVEWNGGNLTEFFRLDSVRTFRISLPPTSVGRVYIQATIVSNEREYRWSQTVSVEDPSRILTIKREVFRTKITPGAKEEWRLSVSHLGKPFTRGEVLASMYDASLDPIYDQDWPAVFWDVNPQYWAVASNPPIGMSAIQCSGSYSRYGRSDRWQRYSRLSFLPSTFSRHGWYRRGAHRQRYIIDDESLTEDDPRNPSGGYSRGVGRASARKVEVAAMANDAMSMEKGSAPGAMTSSDDSQTNEPTLAPKPVHVRRNLQETAFFYPQLRTNERGEVVISFNSPEALTAWKFRAFAHGVNLETGFDNATTLTQKDLMVVPGLPRFLRYNDTMSISVKVVSLADNPLNGRVSLQVFDAETMQPISRDFLRSDSSQPFSVDAKASTSATFRCVVPENVEAVVIRTVAATEVFSDGEENVLPVLPDRMLVQESIPLWVTNLQGTSTVTKTFELANLVKAGQSKSLKSRSLSLQVTPNPTWGVIKSLTYLMEYPWECSEQVMSRVYGNSVAQGIVNSDPRIQLVFNRWRESNTSLQSPLEKNADLKQIGLEETPWLRRGKSQTQEMQRLSMLFDLNYTAGQRERDMKTLQDRQSADGGFAWFPGYRNDVYITSYILTSLGRLDRMGYLKKDDPIANHIIDRALRYLDAQIVELHGKALESEKTNGGKSSYWANVTYLLYTHSCFLWRKAPREVDRAWEYFAKKAASEWADLDVASQARIAVSLHRIGNKTVPGQIMESLKQRAIESEEMGASWTREAGFNEWYYRPISGHVAIMEAIHEVMKDPVLLAKTKVWLLKNRQTNDWGTTIATSDACYALLSFGQNWLSSSSNIAVKLGEESIKPGSIDGLEREAGTGEFRVDFNGSEIKPAMGKVALSKADAGVAWGGLHWSYYEDMSKVKSAGTSALSVKKEYFKTVISPDRGPLLQPIGGKVRLLPGDLLTIRLVVYADRSYTYVHLKDQRAASMEPVSQLPAYRWQGRLSFYETPKDASMNYFIGYLPQGTHVLEYQVRLTHPGRFNAGITSLQCMYAPEFSAHSQGSELTVD